MKKFTFLVVMVLAVFISSDASASFNPRSTPEIQAFFNVMVPNSSTATADKLRETIGALNFHVAQIQNELNSTTSSSTVSTFRSDTSLLTIQTSNNVQTGVNFAGSVLVTATNEDIYVYSAAGKFRSNTGVTTPLLNVDVSGDAGASSYVNHPSLGVVTVIKVPKGTTRTIRVSKTFPISALPDGYVSFTVSDLVYLSGNPLSGPRSATFSTLLWSGSVNIVSHTRDTQPPAITYVSSVASSGVMFISWYTDEISSSKVYYGSSTGSYFTAQAGPSGTTHYAYPSVGIYPDVTYYYVVESIDTAGNKSRSKEYTFILKRPIGIGAFFKNYINNVKAQVVYMFGK